MKFWTHAHAILNTRQIVAPAMYSRQDLEVLSVLVGVGASSMPIICSCSFSPGRIPMISCSASAAIALAISSYFHGRDLFEHKSRHLACLQKRAKPNQQPCSRVIIKRVIRLSVIGKTRFLLLDIKNGITEPRDPSHCHTDH